LDLLEIGESFLLSTSELSSPLEQATHSTFIQVLIVKPRRIFRKQSAKMMKLSLLLIVACFSFARARFLKEQASCDEDYFYRLQIEIDPVKMYPECLEDPAVLAEMRQVITGKLEVGRSVFDMKLKPFGDEDPPCSTSFPAEKQCDIRPDKMNVFSIVKGGGHCPTRPGIEVCTTRRKLLSDSDKSLLTNEQLQLVSALQTKLLDQELTYEKKLSNLDYLRDTARDRMDQQSETYKETMVNEKERFDQEEQAIKLRQKEEDEKWEKTVANSDEWIKNEHEKEWLEFEQRKEADEKKLEAAFERVKKNYDDDMDLYSKQEVLVKGTRSCENDL
jgi:hypothetical protein